MSLSIVGSGEDSGTWGEPSETATSVENARSRISCSDVANAIRDALDAIKAGRVDIARERLADLVDASHKDAR